MNLKAIPTSFVLSISLLTLQAQAQSWLTDGLVAYYQFNGNGNDSSGNGNTASPVNSTFAADRFGNPNSSVRLNGINSVVTVNQPLIDLGQDYTLSLWFSSDDVTKNQQMLALSTGGFWGLAIDYNDAPSTPAGVINWAVGTGPTAHGWSASYIYGNESPYQPSQWYQMLFRKDQHDYRFYIDGQLVSEQTVGVDFSFVPSGFAFGGDVNWNSGWLQGGLDDIRVYNRALSDSEVERLYKRESRGSVPDGGSTLSIFAAALLGVLLFARATRTKSQMAMSVASN